MEYFCTYKRPIIQEEDESGTGKATLSRQTLQQTSQDRHLTMARTGKGNEAGHKTTGDIPP